MITLFSPRLDFVNLIIWLLRLLDFSIFTFWKVIETLEVIIADWQSLYWFWLLERRIQQTAFIKTCNSCRFRDILFFAQLFRRPENMQRGGSALANYPWLLYVAAWLMIDLCCHQTRMMIFHFICVILISFLFFVKYNTKKWDYILKK